MDDKYDAIVLGTGMTECILVGILSVKGYKVLHVDKNQYYGGDCASLNLEQLYQKFGKGAPPAELGKPFKYNVDLTPKLIMADGKLAAILRNTVVSRYNMSFVQIDGSYVTQKGKIHKVPADEREALSSSLMGLFEKRRMQKFLKWVNEYNPKDPKTHKGWDLRTKPMHEVLKEFGVDDNTIDFMGHAIALHTNDDYKNQPALPTIERLQLYANSFQCFGKSPYVYPLYGLCDIPQAFARLCAVFGGTYMVGKPVEEILFDESGKFAGVKSEGEVATAPFVLGDPTYFTQTEGKVKKIGQVGRMIVLMDHPILDKATKDSKSCQVILTQRDLGRKNDVYVVLLSHLHEVVPQGMYVAIISSNVETTNPEQEFAKVLEMIAPGGSYKEKFFATYDQYVPVTTGIEDKCYVTKSLDATSNFQTTCADIEDLYRRITGEALDIASLTAEPKEGQA